MSDGLFVTFEGIDGCGKTTQLASVAKKLEQEGHQVVVTREPGGTPIGERIRSILISPEHSEMKNETELLLYLAARAQHVREKIEPALRAGKVVLCDRFQEATFAYQGYGRGLSLEFLRTINEYATGHIKPHCTFVFNIPVELSQRRMAQMNKKKDRLEQSPLDFYERISKGYCELAEAEPLRIFLVNGDQPIPDITRILYEKISQFIKIDTKTGIDIAT